MAGTLEGKKIAFLVANEGVEQVELTEPWAEARRQGAQTDLIAPDAGEVQAFNHLDKGDRFPVDRTVADVSADDYDALVLPGGVMNPDRLRTHDDVLAFVRAFFDQHKPVGAICHGPWTLINAGVIKGRHVTSWPSLRQDLVNAGARWTDEEVVAENGLVTSRKPDDIPAFNRKLVEEIAEGVHATA